MHALVNIALRAARDAASAIAHSSDRLDRIKVLDHDSSRFLTSMDVDADKTLLYHLAKAYPEHKIRSRVSGEQGGDDSATVWLINALSGNRNFAAGYGQFAVSMACQVNGKLEHAVIINPITGEEFIASRGNGAQLNSRRIRVNDKIDLKGAFVALDSDNLPNETCTKLQQSLLAEGAELRISGCATLDMLAVASGRLQGGFCGAYKQTEDAAATLVLQEAGGFIGDQSGNPDIKSAAQLVYGNQKIFQELVKLHNRR